MAEKMLKILGKENLCLELFIVDKKVMNKNVLSFPAKTDFPRPDLENQPIGEVYLNPKYIEEHEEDLSLMLAHGILHCLNYDHENERDRIEMEEKEQELLRKITS
jgi:rRNA maturation RNase YbeY